jgi:hypothetical protein
MCEITHTWSSASYRTAMVSFGATSPLLALCQLAARLGRLNAASQYVGLEAGLEVGPPPADGQPGQGTHRGRADTCCSHEHHAYCDILQRDT